MIRYVTPFARDKNLAEAMNEEMRRAKPGEYVAFMDRDVWFPHPYYGNQIANTVERHGLAFYTALTPRINCPWQKIDFIGSDTELVQYSKDRYEEYGTEIEDHTHSQLWSGFLMVCPKELWVDLPEKKSLLGVDNLIHKMAMLNGYSIYLMLGIVCYHYYSGYTGAAGAKFRDKSHLK